MIGIDSNRCQVVMDALKGKRTADGQMFTSLAILDERLERLKRYDKMFSGVQFSSAVKKLVSQNSRMPVG